MVRHNKRILENTDTTGIDSIYMTEVPNALRKIKNKNALGSDGINSQ